MTARVAWLARMALAVVMSLIAQPVVADVVVSNVRAQQMTDGTKRVEVLYDLAGAPSGGATVSVAFSA
jgi:hypothetical protein